MRPKLVIAILVLALSGANSGAASLCAAYCMSSPAAGGAAVRHHQMGSQPAPKSISHHIHAHHQGSECAECPPMSVNTLSQKSDCANLVHVQALKEGSFSLDTPNRVAQIDVVDTPANALSLASNRARFLVFGASHTIRSSNPASLPLRV